MLYPIELRTLREIQILLKCPRPANGRMNPQGGNEARYRHSKEMLNKAR